MYIPRVLVHCFSKCFAYYKVINTLCLYLCNLSTFSSSFTSFSLFAMSPCLLSYLAMKGHTFFALIITPQMERPCSCGWLLPFGSLFGATPRWFAHLGEHPMPSMPALLISWKLKLSRFPENVPLLKSTLPDYLFVLNPPFSLPSWNGSAICFNQKPIGTFPDFTVST